MGKIMAGQRSSLLCGHSGSGRSFTELHRHRARVLQEDRESHGCAYGAPHQPQATHTGPYTQRKLVTQARKVPGSTVFQSVIDYFCSCLLPVTTLPAPARTLAAPFPVKSKMGLAMLRTLRTGYV